MPVGALHRLALHDDQPDAAEDEKFFARKRVIFMLAVVNLVSAQPLTQQPRGALQVANDKRQVVDPFDSHIHAFYEQVRLRRMLFCHFHTGNLCTAEWCSVAQYELE